MTEGIFQWLTGNYDAAVALFRDELQQNGDDPLFARYWLVSGLFQMGSTDDLKKYLDRGDDESAVWGFAKALNTFREKGDCEDAQRMLVEAHGKLPGFVRHLLQDEVVDARREIRFDGSVIDQAHACARLFLPAWRAVPGAAVWARGVLRVSPMGATHDIPPRRFPIDELRSLPLRRETWQLGAVRHGSDPSDGGPPLWVLGVVNANGKEIRTVTMIEGDLNEVNVWNGLIQAFLAPMDGSPARPRMLEVCDRDFRSAWKPLLAEIGVQTRPARDPQLVEDLLLAMQRVVEARQLPSAEEIGDIREFPRSTDVWQTDFIRSPSWVMDEEEGGYRPWVVIVLDKSRSAALTTSHASGEPSPELLLEYLVRTMARPGGGDAARPRIIEVSDSDCYDYLRPRLEGAGVTCRLVDELPELNEFCFGLARRSEGSEKCSIADGKGVTRDQMESFYEAADYYFKSAPWRRVPGEVPIEIRCDDLAIGTRYAVVLGRTGVQLGLCVYDDWKMTCAMLGGYAAVEDMRALTVCYDEPLIMSALDLQLIERLGWPIAGPEAWPAVMRLLPRHTPRSPNSDELIFLDACLSTIPDFLEKKWTSATCRVKTGTRSIDLHFRWNP